MYLTDFRIQELKGVSERKCYTILLCQVQEEPREDTWSWYVSVSSSQFECGSNDCDLDEQGIYSIVRKEQIELLSTSFLQYGPWYFSSSRTDSPIYHYILSDFVLSNEHAFAAVLLTSHYINKRTSLKLPNKLRDSIFSSEISRTCPQKNATNHLNHPQTHRFEGTLHPETGHRLPP